MFCYYAFFSHSLYPSKLIIIIIRIIIIIIIIRNSFSNEDDACDSGFQEVSDTFLQMKTRLPLDQEQQDQTSDEAFMYHHENAQQQFDQRRNQTSDMQYREDDDHREVHLFESQQQNADQELSGNPSFGTSNDESNSGAPIHHYKERAPEGVVRENYEVQSKNSRREVPYAQEKMSCPMPEPVGAPRNIRDHAQRSHHHQQPLVQQGPDDQQQQKEHSHHQQLPPKEFRPMPAANASSSDSSLRKRSQVDDDGEQQVGIQQQLTYDSASTTKKTNNKESEYHHRQAPAPSNSDSSSAEMLQQLIKRSRPDVRKTVNFDNLCQICVRFFGI
jgi:hypothetical protein